MFMMSGKRRGVALVTVLFVVLIVAMISRAILINGPSMALKAEKARIRSLARRAAEAGASYARVQILSNRDWKGDANAMTVNTPNMQVLEDNGNVIGWMKGGRQVSMFRIRFNYQDGDPGGETMPDPALISISNIFLSLNNITNTADARVPDVNPATFAVDNPDPDPVPYPGTIICPAGSAMIRVEGWAGGGVDSATGPTSLPTTGAGEFLTKEVIRAVYSPGPPEDLPDASLSAGGGILTELEGNLDVSVVGTGVARLRSKLGVTVKNVAGAPNNLNMTGEVKRDGAFGLSAIHGGITEVEESIGNGEDFFNVDWSDVPQASADPTESIQLPGGIYVVDAAGNFHYYDMNIADFEALPPDPTNYIRPGGVVLSSKFEEVRSAANVAAVDGLNVRPTGYRIDITEDINIVSSAGTSAAGPINDFLVTTLSGRPFQETDTPATNPYMFSGVHPDYAPIGALEIKDSVISNPNGELGLMVDIRGENASLVAETEIKMSAPGIRLEVASVPNVDQRLSVYAKEDVTISTYLRVPANPYVPDYEGYGPLNLEGLIYTLGDVNILAATEGTLAPSPSTGHQGYGDVTITGALVAYGGDPSVFDQSDPSTGPGTALDGWGNPRGKVKILAKSADINYDRTKLVPDLSAFPGAPLWGLVRISYGFENV